MIIRNKRLLDSIKEAITEYNSYLYDPENEHLKTKIPGFKYFDDGKSADIPEETLRKLERFNIYIPAKDVNEDELSDIVNQLSQILDVMHLKTFIFSMPGRQTTQVNMSFLDHLNDDVGTISLYGIDLSQEKSSRFERFNNLHYLSLRKCNITNPQIISTINPKVSVSLRANKIAPEYYKDAFELIKKLNGKIDFSAKKLNTISRDI